MAGSLSAPEREHGKGRWSLAKWGHLEVWSVIPEGPSLGQARACLFLLWALTDTFYKASMQNETRVTSQVEVPGTGHSVPGAITTANNGLGFFTEPVCHSQ